MVNELPKIWTQEDQTRKDVESFKNGTERDRLLMMLRCFSSSASSLPVTDDIGKIVNDATEDFRRSNYGEAMSYVDSLGTVAEFYKDLAERYLDHLTYLGATTDQYGDMAREPFVMMHNGVQVLGRVEVITLEEQEADLSTWVHCIKPYLPYASDSEREWITDNFAQFISEDEGE